MNREGRKNKRSYSLNSALEPPILVQDLPITDERCKSWADYQSMNVMVRVNAFDFDR